MNIHGNHVCLSCLFVYMCVYTHETVAEAARTTASDQKTSKIVGSKQQVLNVSQSVFLSPT